MSKKKTAMPEPAAKTEPEAELSKYIAFEPVVMHRRDLKTASYNPRVMQEEARADLAKCIDKFGLVEPLVWNKRTGILVSGHQRIHDLDRKHGHDNYKLIVAVIDKDEKEEKELNIALNNPNLTGDYDLTKLGEMFKNNEVDVEGTGFSPAQIYQLFGDSALVEQPEQLEVLAAQMREARERYDKIKATCGKRDDMDYYQIVFASVDDRLAWLSAIGVRIKDNRFVNGTELASCYGAMKDRVAALEKELAALGVKP